MLYLVQIFSSKKFTFFFSNLETFLGGGHFVCFLISLLPQKSKIKLEGTLCFYSTDINSINFNVGNPGSDPYSNNELIRE